MCIWVKRLFLRQLLATNHDYRSPNCDDCTSITLDWFGNNFNQRIEAKNIYWSISTLSGKFTSRKKLMPLVILHPNFHDLSCWCYERLYLHKFNKHQKYKSCQVNALQISYDSASLFPNGITLCHSMFLQPVDICARYSTLCNNQNLLIQLFKNLRILNIMPSVKILQQH